jgi:hydrogenase-4 membrane subunit HyfE
MRDWIKRTSIIVIYGLFVWYLLYLAMQDVTIVSSQFSHLNDALFVLLFVFALYKFVLYGIYPVRIKFSKPSLFVFALLLIFVGQYVLQDNVEQYVYIADLTKLLGVILLILSPTNVLYTKKNRKNSKDKGVEIIEV